MLFQRTIAKKVSVTGIGLHSGKKVTLTMYPAESNTGVVFSRIDLPNSTPIQASANSVGTTENATTLGSGIGAIHTVEHLLAVLYGLGIDNIYCEIDGPEIPIMDGSGAPFVFLFKETGIATLNAEKKFIIILEPIKVAINDKWAQIEPSSRLIIDSTIVFPHPQIKTQREIFEFTCENFIEKISRARTFGMLRDVDMLKRKGLGKGGSLDNAIILDEFNVINPEGIRFEKEFVKHKILDTLGDFFLLGHEIAGKITTFKSGHNLHNLLCRKLMATPDAYKVVSASSLQEDTRSCFALPENLSHSFS